MTVHSRHRHEIMNKYHCYTRCIYAEFFSFFQVRPIESVASQWKMLVYSVADSCDLNGKYFPKNCYWVQNEKTITEVCWACISTIMFLIANTWPSVAVRSVQLQLMWNSLPTAVQSSESLDIFRRRLKTELFEHSYSWHCACQTTLLLRDSLTPFQPSRPRP